MLTLDLQTSHGPVGGGQRGAQQLIKPGLMALTLAHNPEEESWRKKGQSSHNIREKEELRGVGCLAGCHLCIDYKADGILLTKTFPKFLPLKMCLSLHSKLAKFESTTFCDLSSQLKAITILFVFKGFSFFKA